MGHKSALLFLLISTSIAFSQTFTVLNETSGTTSVQTIDGTTEFRYSVRLSGVSGNLTGVVPQLLPPSCAQQGGQPLFNTTFMGIVGGSQTNLAIPTWSNNQTRELIFRVHLFNNSAACGSAAGCGGSDFNFQLRFTHSGSANAVTATDPDSNLRIGTPSADGFRVVHVVSETSPDDCGFFVSSIFPSVTFSAFSESLRTDPEIRVFLGIDWNLNINNNPNPNITFATGLDSFLYPTGPAVNEFFRLKEGNVNGGEPLAPFIPQTTEILDQNNVPFPLGPLGGDGPFQMPGDCIEHTWNFFDITDKRPETQAAPPIINHLSNPRIGLFENTVRLNPANNGASFRKAGLYLVRPSGCATGNAFGNPPTQVQFEQYNLLPNGVAEVRLTLPSAWTTSGGTRLRNTYTIEWFYRNNGTLSKASLPGGGATNSRNLNTNLAIPFATPSDFAIEARIRRTGTNAIISVQSPSHDLSYSQLDQRSFENAEFNPATGGFNPDVYLDPGESLVQEIRIQNQGSFANDVTVTAGRITPTSADLAFSGREKTTFFAGTGAIQQVFQRDIASNGVLDVDVLYELLRVDTTCEDLTLFFEVSYRNQGMSTKFRREFIVPANCDIRERAFELDGNWVDAQNSGSPPCNGSNCNGSTVSTQSPTSGWGFADPNWIGSSNDRSVFYTLSSPAVGFEIGSEDQIAMSHQATFPQLDAGGIVEFRTANNGGPWSAWQDLIQPIETRNGTQLYNSSTFTTTAPGFDNVLGGRKVFMNMGSNQNFDLPLPNTSLSGDKVQFRLLYHVVSPSSSPGLWRIADFAYKTNLPQFDDVFGLGENLSFSPCIPTIQLNPSPAGSYTFSWYTSFQNLVDDLAHTISTDGRWDFPSPGSVTDYFVKVRFNTPGTTRYYRLRIGGASSVPPFGTVIADWNTTGTPGTTDLNSSGMVDILDVVLQVNLEACN